MYLCIPTRIIIHTIIQVFGRVPACRKRSYRTRKNRCSNAAGEEHLQQTQFYEVQKYVESVAKDKPVHIGETGWATYSNGFYSDEWF